MYTVQQLDDMRASIEKDRRIRLLSFTTSLVLVMIIMCLTTYWLG